MFKIVPMAIKEANKYVKKWHRHNKPVVAARWAIGVEKEGELVGVAIVGNPIARLLCDGKTAEVLRVATNGERNANSFLYTRCRRICQLMGYEKVITYTLEIESGASLRAIGAKIVANGIQTNWGKGKRKRINQKISTQKKFRWEL